MEVLDGDVLSINKALVQDENKEWVVKTTKTTESTRTIIIPMELADKIRNQGYVYKGHPNSITDCLTRVEKNLESRTFPYISFGIILPVKCRLFGAPKRIFCKWEAGKQITL